MLNRFRVDEQELTDLIEKYLAGTATEEERERLLLWYRRQADQPADWPVTSAGEKLEVKSRMLRNIMEQIKHQQPRKRRVYRNVAAAVVLLLLSAGLAKLLFWPSAAPQPVIYKVATVAGERKIIQLPDSSRVWLGPRSELQYTETFGADNRNVTLSGEGFFEVTAKEDLPFVLHTGQLATKVLGTEFNVEAYPGEATIKVTLLSGGVALAAPNGNSRLQPMQQALYRADSGSIRQYDFPAAAAMLKRREGNIEYKNVTVSEIVKDLEHMYGVTVTLRGRSSSSLFYGRLKANETPEDFLEKLCLVLNMKLEQKEGKFIISKGDCNK
jgi:transmembrane sensor